VALGINAKWLKQLGQTDSQYYIGKCDFSSFEQQGMQINTTQPKVSIAISDTSIGASVDSVLSGRKENFSEAQKSRTVKINSQLGKFYNSAGTA